MSARSAPSGQPPFHARRGHQVVLLGTLPQALARGHRLQREDSTRPLQFTIALRVQHSADLAALILRQQDPKSAQYHRYLSPQAFTAKFGPTSEAVTAVRKYLNDAGLRVTAVSANRMLIDASGSVAQAEKAFDITISQYQLDHRTIYAPDSLPLIPDTLATTVQGVIGLDSVGVVHPVGAHGPSRPERPNAGPGGGFTPTDLRNAYDVTALIGAGGDGTGQRVAVFELAPYIPGDLAAFRSNYSLPSATVNNHSIDGATVTCATAGTSCDMPGVGEADLNVEMVSGLAPNTTQDVYTGPNSVQGLLDTYQAIVTDDADKVVTTSWGLCEPDAGHGLLQAEDNLFAQAAVEGQTVFAAAGDTGSDGCRSGGTLPQAVDSPASDPYVVGVGGTTLTLSSGNYGSEVTWNSSGPPHNSPIGTGGGNSSYFVRPSWQIGLPMPNQFFPVRLVPDVAANADPFTGDSVYCTSTQDSLCPGAVGWTTVGGTSAAAALWAGIFANINDYLIAHSVSAAGWVNYTLYRLLGTAQTYTPFHDVISGDNDVDYQIGGFSAFPCYDQVSGVGTPDAWNIARDLQIGTYPPSVGQCTLPLNQAIGLVQDGDFEGTFSDPWREFSLGGYELIQPVNPHQGSNAAFLCGYPSCDDRIQQLLMVPAAVNSATLNFWYDAFSSLHDSTPTLSCLDHFYVTLATPDGTIIDTLQSSCGTTTNGYTHATIDVTADLNAHLNQPIVLLFRGTAANETGFPQAFSEWFVDDVSLTVS
jgi:kumamolisin